MPYRTIAGLIPTAQSLAILSNVMPSKKKKKKIVKTAVESIVGLSLLKVTAQQVRSL